MEQYLYESVKQNIAAMKRMTENSGDLVIREIKISGIDVAVAASEGMVDSFFFSQIITDNLCGRQDFPQKDGEVLYQEILKKKVISPDEKTAATFRDVFSFLYSGFGVILIDGVPSAIIFGVQGFAFRSIASPTTDENIKGSKEGFVEALKINQTMIRRRMKTPDLVFKPVRLGKDSRTDCALVYLKHIASAHLLKKVEKKLQQADLDMVLESGSVKMLFMEKPLSLFSEIGSTERPDTLCAKLYEGKIGLIIDGTPFALIIPFLFAEHFQSLDDYEYKAVYSNFLRLVKYSAFILSFLLPGLYVALATFHPEVLPDVFREKITEAQSAIAYPFLIEGLVINFAYEVMREAGLRLPKEIGHAVSIVGGLIIGDAAVSAGLISAPMVLVAAMSAISAFVIPSLMDSLVVLRFLFLFLGGFLGMYGIALGFLFVLVNMCIKTVFGVPFSSGIVPTTAKTFRSLVYKSPRQPFASERVPKIQNMPGSQMEDPYQRKEEGLSDFCKFLDHPAIGIALMICEIFLLFTGMVTLVIFAPATAASFPGGLSVFTVSVTFLLLFLFTIRMDLEASGNASTVILFFFLVCALILFWNLLTFQNGFPAVLSGFFASIPAKFAFGDLILSLFCLPFLHQKGFRVFWSFFLTELVFIFIMSMMSLPVFSQYISLNLLFLPAFAFIKICCVLNLANEILSHFLPRFDAKKIKPALCVALFFFSYGFITVFLF